MCDLNVKFLNNTNYKLKLVSTFDLEKVYITKIQEKNSWYRVKIVNIINENEADVILIDVGNITTIRKENLVLLEDLSRVLVKYPNQVNMCKKIY